MNFISCDWGTSSFRIRLVDRAGTSILAETGSPHGIASAFEGWRRSGLPASQRLIFYQSFLLEQIQLLEYKVSRTLAGLPLIVSGMASSSIGMVELSYRSLPCSADHRDLEKIFLAPTQNFPHPLTLISGYRTENDVLRGEETLLIGAGPDPAEAQRLFIFPGTHSKHILVENGRVSDLKTYMTGELFALLAQNSILASSIAAPPADNPDPDGKLFTSFIQGVDEATGSSLLHNIFLTRTNDLFQRLSREENYFYLSGLLIGTELRELPSPTPLTLVSSGKLSVSYAHALSHLGRQYLVCDAGQAIVRAHADMLAID